MKIIIYLMIIVTGIVRAQNEFPLGVLLFGNTSVDFNQMQDSLHLNWAQGEIYSQDNSGTIREDVLNNNGNLKIMGVFVRNHINEKSIHYLSRGQYMVYEAEQNADSIKNHFLERETGINFFQDESVGERLCIDTVHQAGYMLRNPYPTNIYNYGVQHYYYDFIMRIDKNKIGNPIVVRLEVDEVFGEDTIKLIRDTLYYSDFPDENCKIFIRDVFINSINGQKNAYGVLCDKNFRSEGDNSNNKVVDIRVFWYGAVTIYVDKIIVSDSIGHLLFKNQLDSMIASGCNSLNSINHNLLSRYYLWDEPLESSYASHQKIKMKIDSILNLNNTIGSTTAQPDWLNFEKYLNNAVPSELMVDCYPITADIPSPQETNELDLGIVAFQNSDQYNLILQNRLDTFFIPILRASIQASQIKNKEFWFIPQLHGEFLQRNGKFRWDVEPNSIGEFPDFGSASLRPPTGNELKMMINTAIAYGAKGIMAYPYGTDRYWLVDPQYKAIFPGLIDTIKDIDNIKRSHHLNFVVLPYGINQNNVKNVWVGYKEKWDAIDETFKKIRLLKPSLNELDWLGSKSWNTYNDVGIKNDSIIIESVRDTSGNLDNVKYVETGYFKKNNTDYIFVVNRRTFSHDTREIKLKLNYLGTHYINYKIHEIGTENYWIASCEGYFEPKFKPGEGKLFSIKPMLTSNITSSNGDIDTINSGNIIITNDLIVSEGSKLIIEPKSKIKVGGYSTIKIFGTLIADGQIDTSRILITAEKEPFENDIWKGIELYQHNDSSIIRYCDVTRAYNGIELHYSGTNPYVKIENCNIKYTERDGIQIWSEGYIETNKPKIISNSFSKNLTAIWSIRSSPEIISNAIDSCSYGMIFTSGTPFVNSNIITSPTQYGIFIDYGYGSYNNNVISSEYYGVLINYGSPIFYNNLIQNSHFGIWAINSTPKFGGESFNDYGENIIRNCDTCIYCNSASPYFGNYDPSDEGQLGGNNSIYRQDDGKLIVANNGSYIKAQYNWWGRYPPNRALFDTSNYSEVDIENPLESDPNEILNNFIIGGRIESISRNNIDNLLIKRQISTEFDSVSRKWNKQQVLLYVAALLRSHHDFQKAVIIYKEIIKINLRSKWSEYSLKEMQLTYHESERDSISRIPLEINEFKNYLQEIIDNCSSQRIQILSRFILAEELITGGDLNNSIIEYEEIVRKSTDSYEELNSLFGLFNIYYFYQRDTNRAKDKLEEISQKYPEEEITQLANSIYKGYKFDNNHKLSSLSKISIDKLVLPNEYELSQNYPNPYNSETTISYQVPMNSYIKIILYSILGEEVQTLVNSYHKVGSYKVKLESKGLSTGMYIYKIEAKGEDGNYQFINAKKMVLMK